jgi:hypothetical protein
MLHLWLVTASAAPPAPPAPAPEIEIVGQTLQGPVRLTLPGREGDKLFVDGWEWGVLPVDTELAEGEHEFRVEGPKGEKLVVKFMVSLTAGQVTLIDLRNPGVAPVVAPAPAVVAPVPVPQTGDTPGPAPIQN